MDQNTDDTKQGLSVGLREIVDGWTFCRTTVRLRDETENICRQLGSRAEV